MNHWSQLTLTRREAAPAYLSQSWARAVSRCRSNAVGQESFECFAWGEVAQDCAGAFVEFLGDGVARQT